MRSISRSSCGTAAETKAVIQIHIKRDASITLTWSNLIQNLSKARNVLKSWKLKSSSTVSSFPRYLARIRRSTRSSAPPYTASPQNLARKIIIPSRGLFQIWRADSWQMVPTHMEINTTHSSKPLKRAGGQATGTAQPSTKEEEEASFPKTEWRARSGGRSLQTRRTNRRLTRIVRLSTRTSRMTFQIYKMILSRS